jgi:hypothetical protein
VIQETRCPWITTPSAVDAPSDAAAAITPVPIVRAASRAWADRDEETLREHLDLDLFWRAAVGTPYAGTDRGPEGVSVLLCCMPRPGRRGRSMST